MKRILLVVPLVLAGCAAIPVPEPIVRTVTVEVPVFAACVPDNLGANPGYPDTDDALRSAAGPAERMLLMFQGRSARDQRLSEVEIALENCREIEND
jgi:hypothetical protein